MNTLEKTFAQFDESQLAPNDSVRWMNGYVELYSSIDLPKAYTDQREELLAGALLFMSYIEHHYLDLNDSAWHEAYTDARDTQMSLLAITVST